MLLLSNVVLRMSSFRCSTTIVRKLVDELRFKRTFSVHHVTDRPLTVAVLGASGGVGQPLALLLKHSQLISKLSLYDLAHSEGVACDLSHIETKCHVVGYVGENELNKSLTGCDVVIIPAGIPRRPGMSRDDLFFTNASIVYNLVKACTEMCPKAIIGVISNPINSTLVIASEVFKKAGCYDPNKLFGITTLDVIRANTFISEVVGVDPEQISCPVVGGHSGVTICPLISQSKIKATLSPEQLKQLTERIQEGGTEVVNAKAGAGSATLSMAYAAARFTFSVLHGLMDAENIIECAYVRSDVTEAKYFATPVLLGPHGMKKNLGIGKVTAFEQELINKAIPEIKKNIAVGEAFDPAKRTIT